MHSNPAGYRLTSSSSPSCCQVTALRYCYFTELVFSRVLYRYQKTRRGKMSNMAPPSKAAVSSLYLIQNILKFLTFVLGGVPYLIWALRKRRPALIHAHDIGFAGLMGLVVAKILRIKFVVQVHGSLATLNSDVTKQNSTYEVIIGKFIAAKASAVIVVSEYLKKYYLALGVKAEKFFVIHMAVNLSLFKTSSSPLSEASASAGSETPFIIGYIGRLSKEKNISNLLEAFSIAKKNSPRNLKLLLVGAGPEEQTLRNLSKKLEIAENVIFLGYRKDIPVILRKIDIFVLPSYAEGCPNALLEAMAAKKSIVASNIPGIRTVITDGVDGLLFNPNSPENMAEKILLALKNDPLRAKLGANAYATVSIGFNLLHEYKKMTQIYHNVMLNSEA